MHPILHWAGGKTQFLDEIMSSMPEHYNNYYEPFLGGGAVLLGVAPKKAYVNDINPQLINLYTQLKLNVQGVLERIDALDAVPCDKEYYNNMRYLYNNKIAQKEFDLECAALMVWINKHCFNGLYRVNDIVRF